MRVLSFGTDKNVFDSESAVFARQRQYAARFDALDIIVPACGETVESVQNDYTRKIEGNITVYPTGTSSKVAGFFALIRKGLFVDKPDVVTVQDPFELGLAALVVARLRRVPLHAQLHTDPFAKGFVRGSLLNRARRILAMFVLRRATRIRVVLGRLKEELEARGITAPVTVLPIYAEVSRLGALVRTRDARYAFSVLCIGRLTSEKNISLALRAVLAARREGFDVGLTILGDGPLRSALESEVHELGLIGRVSFEGTQRDITGYLSTADVVLVPSKFEGYGLVIVEALAAHVPVIATDVGVAREAGAVVTDEKGFIGTFLSWLKNGKRTAELGAEIYKDEVEYIARYTADIAACQE